AVRGAVALATCAPGARSEDSGLAAGELADRFDHHLGMVALNVVSAVVNSDMACGREIRSDLILKTCRKSPVRGRFALWAASARQHDGRDVTGDGTVMNLLAGRGAVADFPPHDPRHVQGDRGAGTLR